jgi:hypothetical protein
MKYSSIIIIVISFLLSACVEKTNKPVDTEITVVDLYQDLTVESDLKLSDIASDIKYTKLETNVDCLIQRVDNYSITDDYILIYDRGQDLILLFACNGDYIRKISRKGNGPGEYNRPNDVRIAHDESCILIHNQKTVLRYSLDGEYLGLTPLPSWANKIDTHNDGLIGFFSSAYSTYMDNYSLVTFDWEGNITGQYGKRNWDWLQPGHPMAQARFYYYYDCLNVHENYYDTVYCLTKENEFIPKLVFNGENKPERDLKKIQTPFYQRTDVHGYFRHGWIETPDFILINGSLERMMHNLIYNRKTGLIHAFPYNKSLNTYGIPNDLDGGALYWPGRYSDGKLYSLQYPSRLKPVLDNELIETAEYVDQNLRDKLLVFRGELSEEDGPVLIEVTLK